MNKAITIISVLYKDFGTLDCMIRIATSTSNNIKKIFVCDNNYKNNQHIRNKYANNKLIEFFKGKNKSKNSSMNHGVGINTLLNFIDTPLTAIIEPDVLLLNNGWDTLPHGVDIMSGAKYNPDINGFFGFYPCFLVAKTDKIKHVDFRPGPGNADGFKITPTSNKTYCDTGWQLDKENLSPKILKSIKCNNNNCKVILNDFFGHKTNEFWLDGYPIAAHLWRGSEPERRGTGYKKDILKWQLLSEEIINRIGKQ